MSGLYEVRYLRTAERGLIKLKSMRLSGQDQDDINHLESIIDED